jgi:membrane associated rhomboid family serine protease
VLAVDDRSFVRFGGLAAILIALTSWGAVLAYATLIDPEEPRLGLQIFQFLYALIAFWALFAVVAVYYRARSVGEAWALFATLVGVAAAVGTMIAAMYAIAALRQTPPVVGISPTNPLSVMSFGLTGLWFLTANLLLWRTNTPRPLVLLGFVTAAVLLWGFLSGLSENGGVVYVATVFAGAVGGPIYWLWLGRQLRRDA